MSFHFALPALPRYLRPEDRTAIEAQIEALIGLLDEVDGDPDVEDDDPAGGNVEDDRQQGEGQAYYRLPPEYRIDQSSGPVNEVAAVLAHRRDMGWVV